MSDATGHMNRPGAGPSVGKSSNGCGTAIYGKRDFLDDGSFVTTKWVIFFWIPIVPLNSMRVRVAQQTRLPGNWLASLLLALGGVLAYRSSANYIVYSKRRPVLQQVVYIYAFVLALGLAWWNFGTNPNLVNGASVCLLLALPFILRKVAESRAEQAGNDYTRQG
jgi:hypothetical protein